MSRNCGGRRSGWPGWGEGVGGRAGCCGGLGRRRPAHPVVVACLLQGGAEEEAAAGDACISGTLDVPVGAGEVGGWQRARGPPYRGRPWDPGTWLGSGCPGSCCQSRPVSFASGPPRTWSRSAAMSPECPGGPRKRSRMGARRPRGTENQRGRPRDRGVRDPG